MDVLKSKNERKLEATDTHYTHVSKRSHVFTVLKEFYSISMQRQLKALSYEQFMFVSPNV